MKNRHFFRNIKTFYSQRPNLDKTKEEILVENLKEIKEIFDKHNIKFWLDWGTLLGAVRDGKIISWDHDIDIGVMSNDSKKIISILPKLKEKEFFVDNIPGKKFSYRKFSFIRFGCLIDVWLYYSNDEDTLITFSGKISHNFALNSLWILWRVLMSNKNEIYIFRVQFRNKLMFTAVALVKYCLFLFPQKLRNLFAEIIKRILMENNYSTLAQAVVPKHYFEKLRKIKFYGMVFNVPFNAENYLKYKYGEDWKTPKKEWEWTKDDGAAQSLVKNNNH